MKVVILAAGKATRIRPFSSNKPKGLIRLANIPLLEHTFMALTKLKPKITNIILITGYLEDQIKNHFKESFQNISITYITQAKQKGTGHAALLAKKCFETTSNSKNQDEEPVKNISSKQFILLNGDDIYSWQDLQKLTTYSNTILLQERQDVSAFGVVTVSTKEKGVSKVIGLVEKPPLGQTPPSNFINTGAFSFTTKIFSILENLKESPRGEYELTDAVKVLAKQKQMHAVFTKHLWSPVGYPWHILQATKTILEKQSKNQLLHFGTVDSGAIVEGNVSIDKGSKIAKGTRLTGQITIGKDVIIKQNCTISGFITIASKTIIEENTIISNSVIGSNTKIFKNCHIHDSVIGDNVTIKQNITTNNTKDQDQTIKVQIKGKSVDTKLTSLGAFISDNTVVKKNTKPGEIVE